MATSHFVISCGECSSAPQCPLERQLFCNEMRRSAVTVSDDRIHPKRLHPIHGVLLAGSIPLFLGSLLSDLAYSSSYQIQWSTFASWFTLGGLVFTGFALLWAIINLIRANNSGGRALLYTLFYTLLLLTTWVMGFFNSLVHARDAWGSMPSGLVLSAIIFLLACASTWIGFAKFGVGDGR